MAFATKFHCVLMGKPARLTTSIACCLGSGLAGALVSLVADDRTLGGRRPASGSRVVGRDRRVATRGRACPLAGSFGGDRDAAWHHG